MPGVRITRGVGMAERRVEAAQGAITAGLTCESAGGTEGLVYASHKIDISTYVLLSKQWI